MLARGPVLYIALAVCGIFTLVLLSSLSYGDHIPDRYKPSSVLASYSCSSSTHPPAAIGEGCDNPFLEYGYIDDDAQTWKPYSNCAPIPVKDMEKHLDGLQDKRYYFYGDSVTRNAMTDFCRHIGAELVSHDDPPDHFTIWDDQKIHSCSLPEINFTAAQVYNYGLKALDNSTVDRRFVEGHPCMQAPPERDGKFYWAENRIRQAQEHLSSKFGTADAVFMGTGVWDLGYLAQAIINAYIERDEEQTDYPPKWWIDEYERRLHIYFDTARKMHAPTLKRIHLITFHEMNKMPGEDGGITREWGMSGQPEEFYDQGLFVEFTDKREKAVRNAQIRVARQQQQRHGDMMILPYDSWVRNTPEDKRMRDRYHAGEEPNKIFSMAAIMSGKTL